MPRRSAPNPLAQALGQRISALRQEQGITAEKLAYESDVGSKGYLSDIEHGLALPSLTTLGRIAERLEVSLYDLLIVPTRTDRERLVDLTRGLPKGQLARLLREVSEARPAPVPIPTPRLHTIRAYPTLEVAAGWSTRATNQGEPSAQSLRLPGKFDQRRDFAVRASGSSMQGFRAAIHDGDWLVMRKAQLELGAVVGQVALVARTDGLGDKSLHLKRVVQVGRRLWLHSDDATVKPIAVTEMDRSLATLVSVVAPASLAPPQKSRFARRQFSAWFGLEQEPGPGWSRIEGHLFIVVEPGALKPNGVLSIEGCTPRPAETAFVLLISGESFEYRGLARFDEARHTWRLEKALGTAARRLFRS